MPATLAYDLVGDDLMVLVHGRENPPDDEWSRYIEELRQIKEHAPNLQGLIVTDGGGPNSVQRAELNEKVLGGRTMSGAVITESRFARGIVTALSWFNPGIKAYSPRRFRDAFNYLGLDEQTQGEAMVTVSRLRGQLGLTPFEGMPAL